MKKKFNYTSQFSPINDIIPRTLTKIEENHYGNYTIIIDDIVNTGSYILSLDCKSKDEGDLIIPPIMLFRHSLDLLDSVSTLLKVGSSEPAKILVRSLYETSLYLEYLFKGNTKEKCKAYLVASYLKKIAELESFNPHNINKTAYEKITTSKESWTQIESLILQKKELLKSPFYRDAYDYYRKSFKSNQPDPKWYSYFKGPTSLRKLAVDLKKETAYRYLYSSFSNLAHGDDVFHGKLINTSGDNTGILQLRHGKDTSVVFTYCLYFTIEIFFEYLNNRLSSRISEFKIFLNQLNELRKFLIRTTSNLNHQ